MVGEIAADPHMVTFGSLASGPSGRASSYERRSGGALAYFARFRVPDAAG